MNIYEFVNNALASAEEITINVYDFPSKCGDWVISIIGKNNTVRLDYISKENYLYVEEYRNDTGFTIFQKGFSKAQKSKKMLRKAQKSEKAVTCYSTLPLRAL